MTNELERLKTTCLAQEAEIARLQSVIDGLKSYCEIEIEKNIPYGAEEYWQYRKVLNEINRITGVKE